jgi:glycerol-3-phosphate dehydrogenase
LKKEKDKGFEDTATYRAVSKLYHEKTGKDPIYAIMPEVVISGPKLSREYNTNWFATRVNGRYQTCMQRAKRIKI